MSGGGGSGQTTTTVQKADPWAPAQPYILEALRRGQTISQQPGAVYPGPTTLPATPQETAYWNQRGSYDSSVFGGTPQLNFGNTAGAYGSLLNGGAYGSLASGLGDTSSIVRKTFGDPGAAPSFNPNVTAPWYNTSIARPSFDPRVMAPSFDTNIQAPSFNPNVSAPSFDPRVAAPTFDTSLNPYGLTPQFGVAGNLDARNAFEKALSGVADYSGVQGAVDAANAPILRQLNQDIIPGLNQRATFLNNGTGGIKTLNRVLPDVAERMSQNANTLYEGERQRALAAQQAAAGTVAQGGLGAYGLGLQGATSEAGLREALAQMGLTAGTASTGYARDLANLGLSANTSTTGYARDLANMGLNAATASGSLRQALAQMGLTANTATSGNLRDIASMGLTADTASGNLARDAAQMGLTASNATAGYGRDLAQLQQSGLSDWRSQILGLGNLAGSYAGGATGAATAGLAASPSIYGLGATPLQTQQDYANYARTLGQANIDQGVGNYNYLRDYPQNMLSWYASLANAGGGQGGTQTGSTTQPSGSKAGGILGGALAGGTLAGMITGMNPLLGIGLGALTGLF